MIMKAAKHKITGRTNAQTAMTGKVKVGWAVREQISLKPCFRYVEFDYEANNVEERVTYSRSGGYQPSSRFKRRSRY